MSEIRYGYICTWRGKRLELWGDENSSTYKIQQQATAEFQKTTRTKIKSWEVDVHLAEKNGDPVIHTADF